VHGIECAGSATREGARGFEEEATAGERRTTALPSRADVDPHVMGRMHIHPWSQSTMPVSE